MGLYTEQIVPRIVDVACNMKESRAQRHRVCEQLSGDVIEIGFGSGLNVPYYPEAVSEVTAVEPADVGWKLAGKRLRDTSVPIHRAGLDAQTLPFPDDRFDAAAPSTSSSTVWLPTRACSGGSTVSIRSSSASSAAVI
jgi:ubiquinone/menaquinone biosynthesis C-methylase UbiE